MSNVFCVMMMTDGLFIHGQQNMLVGSCDGSKEIFVSAGSNFGIVLLEERWRRVPTVKDGEQTKPNGRGGHAALNVQGPSPFHQAGYIPSKLRLPSARCLAHYLYSHSHWTLSATISSFFGSRSKRMSFFSRKKHPSNSQLQQQNVTVSQSPSAALAAVKGAQVSQPTRSDPVANGSVDL